jgi:hypothetical protein
MLQMPKQLTTGICEQLCGNSVAAFIRKRVGIFLSRSCDTAIPDTPGGEVLALRFTTPNLNRCLIPKACGWLIAALSLGLVASICTSARAQCVLPPSARAQLQQSAGATQWDQLTAKAFVEADIPSCTDQAIADFKTLSTWPDASPNALGMAAGALEYLAAVKRLQQGDLLSAVTGLHHVVQNYLISSVQDRAISLLIHLTANNPASPEWDLLTPILEERSKGNDGAGYALGGIELLATHDLASGHAVQGQARICSFLAKPLPMQDRFKAQVLLLEYLVAEHDFDSAQVLTVNVDEDFGRQLLAPDWRVRYLRASVAAWSVSSTTNGRERLARYQQGLQIAQGEMQ